MTTGIFADPAYLGDAPVPGSIQDVDPSPMSGNWPRMITLDDETEGRLKQWLREEIRMARIEKEPLIDDWTKWQKQYWAEPAQKTKDWPFQRAANIVVPLTATATEAIYARLMNTLFSVEPFWSIRPKSMQWIDAAPKVEKFLQAEVENENALDAYDFCTQSLLELVKLGTGIGKSGYERNVRKSMQFFGDGSEEPRYVEINNGATLDYVPVANFLMRAGDRDPQESAWCGEEHTFTWGQMKRMSQSGRFIQEAVEKAKHHWVTVQSSHDPSQEYQEEVDKLANQEPLWHEEFHVQEVWAEFDVDGDGINEEIVLDYHWESETILSIRYNWYADLHRPYRIANYYAVEGRWAGIGIGKMNEQFQAEVTTIRRQRLDNATLANMRMIAIKKTSQYGPDEPIFPGKMWFLDDPNDIQPIELSEIYQSSVINENSVVRDSEKRTGVNEVLLGMPDEGTPGTATGDLARIAEGNKRFDLILKNVRRWLSLLGQDVLSNYQQFGSQGRHFLIMGEDGQFVEQVLRMPQELVVKGAIVEVTATDTITNRQVEQQQWMGLFQLLTNHYRQVIELQGVLDPQQLGPIIQRAILVSDEAMKRLLETFNVLGAEKLALSGGEDGPTASPAGAPTPTANGGSSGRPSPASGSAGLENLLQNR